MCHISFAKSIMCHLHEKCYASQFYLKVIIWGIQSTEPLTHCSRELGRHSKTVFLSLQLKIMSGFFMVHELVVNESKTTLRKLFHIAGPVVDGSTLSQVFLPGWCHISPAHYLTCMEIWELLRFVLLRITCYITTCLCKVQDMMDINLLGELLFLCI